MVMQKYSSFWPNVAVRTMAAYLGAAIKTLLLAMGFTCASHIHKKQNLPQSKTYLRTAVILQTALSV